MDTLGRHLLGEFYGCDAALSDDLEGVRTLLLDAAAAVGATVVGDAFHRYDPHGVSGTLLIAESHLSVHTWPEHGYVAIDIFTCGGLDPRPGFELVAQRLDAASTRTHEVWRGLPEHVGAQGHLAPDDVRLITRTEPTVRRRP